MIHNGKPDSLRAKVYAGSHGNLLPLRRFLNMYPNPINRPTLENNNIRLSYNGKELQQHGTFNLTFPANSKSSIIAAYAIASNVYIMLLCYHYAAIKCILCCY